MEGGWGTDVGKMNGRRGTDGGLMEENGGRIEESKRTGDEQIEDRWWTDIGYMVHKLRTGEKYMEDNSWMHVG